MVSCRTFIVTLNKNEIWTDIVISVLGIISTLEIFAIEFHFGFKILSQAWTNIILAISYSFLSSVIFYFITNYLPLSQRRKSLLKIINSKMTELCDIDYNRIHNKLVCSRNVELSEEVFIESFKMGDSDLRVNFITASINDMKQVLEYLISHDNDINHKVLPILNDAYYQLLFITFDQEDKETGYKGLYQFFEKLDSDMKEIDECETKYREFYKKI